MKGTRDVTFVNVVIVYSVTYLFEIGNLLEYDRTDTYTEVVLDRDVVFLK